MGAGYKGRRNVDQGEGSHRRRYEEETKPPGHSVPERRN